MPSALLSPFFFFNDTATTEIYTLSLHDALPILFDERTGQTHRWAAPQYSTPYTSSLPDKNGYVYAPSNMSERMYRLDPKTGEVLEDLIPTEFHTQKIPTDPTAAQPPPLLANTPT